jgi:hypothetical protein
MIRAFSPTPDGTCSPFVAVLAGIGLLWGLACDVTIKDGDVSVRHLRGRATQQWSRSYPLAPAGRFEMTSSGGPVEIVSGAPGNVHVEATMTATAATDERAGELLKAARIEETAAPDRIVIAGQPGRRGGDVEIGFTVTVPPDTHVVTTLNNDKVTANGLEGHFKAMVVNGEIELGRHRGTVDAAAVNGRISIQMAQVTGRVRVESTNGQISIEVPRDARATLNARSVNGGIAVTGLNTQEADTLGRRIRTLESQLNGGGPEIDVRVTNGRITIEGK